MCEFDGGTRFFCRHFSLWINFGIGLNVEGKKTVDVCARGRVSFVSPVFVWDGLCFVLLSRGVY